MDTKKPLPAELPASSAPSARGLDMNDPPPPYTAEAPSEPLKQAPSDGSVDRSIDEVTQHLKSQRLGSQNPATQRLRKPIAIPATSKKTGSPFMRAYPSDLYHFAIPKEIFLPFLDGINRVTVASPPFQVLDLAGAVISFVPVHELNIIGGGISAAAKIGGKVVSKAGTEIYLRKANTEIFRPLGLKVEIAKTAAVAKMADIPILNHKGKVQKKKLRMPQMEEAGSSRPILGQERSLRAFEPYIAPLEMSSLPEMESKSNPLSKMNAGASEHQRKKEEKKMQKRHDKQERKHAKRTAKREAKYRRRVDELNATQSKMEQHDTESQEVYRMKMEELNRRKAKNELRYDTRMAKGERKRDRKEKGVKDLRKVLWLVIRNVDDDSGDRPDPYTDEHAPLMPTESQIATAASHHQASHHHGQSQHHGRNRRGSTSSSSSDSSSSSSSSDSDSE